MRQMLDSLKGQHPVKEEWRYVSMGYGDQYVMITGMRGMHKWCVDN